LDTHKALNTLPDVLAFDFGERRIGIAFANGSTSISSALGTATAQPGKPPWAEIDVYVAEWKPTVLVVGMPYNMDGSDSPMTEKATQFANQLQERYQLPIDTIDERLTSVEASSLLREQRKQGLRRKHANRADIDSLAARLIAESWLSRKSHEIQKQ